MTTSSHKGFFTRALDRLVEARQQQANQIVRSYLGSLDGTTDFGPTRRHR